MKTISKFFLSLVVFTGLFSSVNAQNNQTPVKDDAGCKLLAVSFYADWCPVCKAIGPSVMDLQGKLKDQPVKFLKFDFTNDETKSKTAELAKSMGLTDVLNSSNSTGYVLLLNPATKKEVGKLTRGQTSDEMYKTVAQLIK